ncbi:MAG: hypothetical protein JST80_11905 [Bdellovibrionales bacterium]|nr:hypothetical protein [Bdellovibrionales bacterium]
MLTPAPRGGVGYAHVKDEYDLFFFAGFLASTPVFADYIKLSVGSDAIIESQGPTSDLINEAKEIYLVAGGTEKHHPKTYTNWFDYTEYLSVNKKDHSRIKITPGVQSIWWLNISRSNLEEWDKPVLLKGLKTIRKNDSKKVQFKEYPSYVDRDGKRQLAMYTYSGKAIDCTESGAWIGCDVRVITQIGNK